MDKMVRTGGRLLCWDALRHSVSLNWLRKETQEEIQAWENVKRLEPHRLTAESTAAYSISNAAVVSMRRAATLTFIIWPREIALICMCYYLQWSRAFHSSKTSTEPRSLSQESRSCVTAKGKLCLLIHVKALEPEGERRAQKLSSQTTSRMCHRLLSFLRC